MYSISEMWDFLDLGITGDHSAMDDDDSYTTIPYRTSFSDYFQAMGTVACLPLLDTISRRIEFPL